MNSSFTVSRYTFLIIASCFAITLSGQRQHHLFPEEDQTQLAKEPVLCKPGVPNKSRGKGLEIQTGINSGRDLYSLERNDDSQSPTHIRYSESFLAKVKIPIINAPSFKMLAGYEYQQEKFHFDKTGGLQPFLFESLDNKALKGNKFSLYLSKSFNQKYYAALRLRTAFDGDYDGLVSFDERYASQSALALFGVKPREDVEWGVGLSFSHNSIRTRVLPFMIYNRTFNDRWGLEFVLPVQLNGRYNFSPRSLLLFGAEYFSDSFTADLTSQLQGEVSEYFVRHSGVDLKVSWEKHLFSWVWFNAQAGYQLPLNSEFQNLDLPNLTLDTRQENNLFFKVGLFISPSDAACMKK